MRKELLLPFCKWGNGCFVKSRWGMRGVPSLWGRTSWEVRIWARAPASQRGRGKCYFKASTAVKEYAIMFSFILSSASSLCCFTQVYFTESEPLSKQRHHWPGIPYPEPTWPSTQLTLGMHFLKPSSHTACSSHPGLCPQHVLQC